LSFEKDEPTEVTVTGAARLHLPNRSTMTITIRARTAWTATALLTLSLLASRVQAHEHHTDNIPVGEGISPDPIVRARDVKKLELEI